MLTLYPDLVAALDLRYKPVANNNPRFLTPGQIAQFNERGYIEPIRLFEGEELKRVQKFFADAEPRMNRLTGEVGGGQFLSMHHLMPELYDIVAYPHTVGHLRDLIGSDIVCHVSQFINKPPGQTKGGDYHQDATFNAMDARSAIIWLAVQDADEENGCMWFIPGSHKLGVVECTAEHHVVNASQYGQGFPCEVPAGYGVIMNDLLMHSSPANHSKNRYRPGFTATYISADVRPHKDANQWATLCCGSDSRGYWKPHPRPAAGPKLFSS